MDLLVTRGEDFVVDERPVAFSGTVKGFSAVRVGVDLMTLPGGSEAGGASELSLSEWVAKVTDLVCAVMAVLGLSMVEEEEVVFVRGVKDFTEAVVVTATGEGFVRAALLLLHVDAGGEETEGFERTDMDFCVTSVTAALTGLLALPHSASTSAMISPPAIESKVSREDMSASKQLRLLSPGNIGGWDVGKGGACSFVLLTLPAVTLGEAASDGVVAVLSCADKFVRVSLFSIFGLSRDRGWDLGVRVRSSLMISTLLARDDMRSGLGGASSLSSLSFDFNFTLPKRPLSPRRWRPTGWDTVLTRRLPVPLRPPLRSDKKLRDLAELAEEIEARAWAKARTPSSSRVSSSVCSVSPRFASCPFSLSGSRSGPGASVSVEPSGVLLLLTGDLLFPPSPLLRMEKMLPGFRLPNSLNPFLIFPLDWVSLGGGSTFSICTSILSLYCPSPSPPVTCCCSYIPASGEGICIQTLSVALI